MSGHSHSVEKHLSVRVAEYDAQIRLWVPFYDEMLDALCGALQRLVAQDARVLDLGAGTGALSARIAQRMPAARLMLLDADAAMLEEAGARGFVASQVLHQSFTSKLPLNDASVASLALHHVRAPAEKLALYRNIRASCGVLLIGDAYVAERGPLREAIYSDWEKFLVAGGDTEAQARARLAEWALEDHYFPLPDELGWLREAGFSEVDVVWRRGPMAVVAAR